MKFPILLLLVIFLAIVVAIPLTENKGKDDKGIETPISTQDFIKPISSVAVDDPENQSAQGMQDLIWKIVKAWWNDCDVICFQPVIHGAVDDTGTGTGIGTVIMVARWHGLLELKS